MLLESRDAFTDQVKRIAVLSFNRQGSLALRCFGTRPSITIESPASGAFGVDDSVPIRYRLDDGAVNEGTASSFGNGTAQIDEDWPLLVGLRSARRIAFQVTSKSGMTSDLSAEPAYLSDAFSYVMGPCLGTIKSALADLDGPSQERLNRMLFETVRPTRDTAPPLRAPREDWASAPLQPELPRSDRASFSSQAGWSIDYSRDLLSLSREATDLFDRAKGSYNTVWHSTVHGKDVVIYVQVSPNSQCRGAADYAREQVAPRRVRVASLRDIPDPSGVRRSVMLEGRGFRTNGGVQDLVTVDFITHRRNDPSTLVHVGGRFPPHVATTFRGEFMRMLDSMELPRVDSYRRSCG